MSYQKLPNLIIAGVNRAGTTSLYSYLSLHPDICASKIKEVNYFMPVCYHNKLAIIEEYISYFKHCQSKARYWMEASPRYMVGGGTIAQAIHDQLGLVKIVFMLRDPTLRFLSYYKQRKTVGEIGENISFENYVDRALHDFKEIRKKEGEKEINVYEVNVYVRGLAEGFYSSYLSQWRRVFGDHMKVCFLEDLKNDTTLFMDQLCGWLEIESEIYHGSKFSIENRSVIYRSDKLAAFANAVNNRFEGFFRKHHRFKRFLRDIFYLLNEQQNDTKPALEEEFVKLRAVYEPFNKELFDLLTSWGYDGLPEWLTKTA